MRWARKSATRFSTIEPTQHARECERVAGMIGDATVLALSEAAHGDAEPLEFRNQLMQYLVRNKGFTAIGIESGIVEGRVVHDYVLGKSGTRSRAGADGISWGFDQLPQNHSLVRWLRRYNADSQHDRPVNFYGFDVPGSPGVAGARRGLGTALAAAVDYLQGVDLRASALFRTRIKPLRASLHFDFHRRPNVPGYDTLSQADRDTLTAIIADLIALLERRETEYSAASSVRDYEWACRAAIGARQVDCWLRQIPREWRPSGEPIELPNERFAFLAEANDVRDRGQADNLDWIVRQEGPSGKLLIFAHQYHLSTAPVRASWSASHRGERRAQAVLGTYLRPRLGKRLFTIGTLIGSRKAQAGSAGVKQSIEPAVPGSIDELGRDVGAPRFLLDLRAAPAGVRHWLARERELGRSQDKFKLALGLGFDALFYWDTVTPAGSA